MKLNRAPATPAAPLVRVDDTHMVAESFLTPEKRAKLADPLLVGSPMPKSLGRCADLYHDVRDLRLLMEKECEAIKARETEIQEHIIRTLPKGDTGASGLRYRAQIKMEDKPQVDETKGGWPALWEFIAASKRFDLLQKRLGEKAIADMWEQGEAVPGVAVVHVPKLSITKI